MSRLRNDDTGAVAVMVAILMSTMILALGAIVVDIGALQVERRELQNGADAGALAVAQGCIEDASCDTDTSAAGIASELAVRNANDDKTTIDLVCGKNPPGRDYGLEECPASDPDKLTECPEIPADGPLADAPYVQVETSTLRADDSTVMPPILAGASRELLGGPAYEGTTVAACARAAWGAPSSLSSGLALTISFCEWDMATDPDGDGVREYAPQPPYPPNPPGSFERILKLSSPGDAVGACPRGGHSGFDSPGAFGWTEDLDDNCTTDIDESGEYGPKTGVGVPTACKDALEDAATPPYPPAPVVYLPIYNGVEGSGSGTKYTLEGYAAFVVTGYRIPGWTKKSWLTGGWCGPASSKCLSGFFTQGLAPSPGGIGAGPYMGAAVVQMIG